MENTFHGTGVALVTPFDEDKSVDFNALENIVEYQIANGTDYLVVLGTTAEAATLTKEEKKDVIAAVIKANDKRIPVVVGVGGNNTLEICELIKSMDFDGIDAILSVVPFYSKPSQEGMYQHFMAIEEVCPVSIMLYNVPGRTSANMSAETTIRLSQASSKFIGVKEASGDLGQCANIIRSCAEGFAVISGDDGLIVPLISIGAKGVVSVAANVCPELISSMTNAALEGDFKRAAKKHMSLIDFTELLFCEGNPAGAKAALSEIGICKNELRLPLVSVSEATYDALAEQIQENSIV